MSKEKKRLLQNLVGTKKKTRERIRNFVRERESMKGRERGELIILKGRNQI